MACDPLLGFVEWNRLGGAWMRIGDEDGLGAAAAAASSSSSPSLLLPPRPHASAMRAAAAVLRLLFSVLWVPPCRAQVRRAVRLVRPICIARQQQLARANSDFHVIPFSVYILLFSFIMIFDQSP